jgi:hypothetical protein
MRPLLLAATATAAHPTATAHTPTHDTALYSTAHT